MIISSNVATVCYHLHLWGVIVAVFSVSIGVSESVAVWIGVKNLYCVFTFVPMICLINVMFHNSEDDYRVVI